MDHLPLIICPNKTCSIHREDTITETEATILQTKEASDELATSHHFFIANSTGQIRRIKAWSSLEVINILHTSSSNYFIVGEDNFIRRTNLAFHK